GAEQFCWCWCSFGVLHLGQGLADVFVDILRLDDRVRRSIPFHFYPLHFYPQGISLLLAIALIYLDLSFHTNTHVPQLSAISPEHLPRPPPHKDLPPIRRPAQPP